MAALRNFWLEAEIQGRQTKISGGPRTKDSTMFVTLKVPGFNGQPHELLELTCAPNKATPGLLHVTMRLRDKGGQIKESVINYDSNTGTVSVED